jgi:hypothetical protein
MTKILQTGLTASLLTAFTLSLAPLAAQAAPPSAPRVFDLAQDGDVQILQVRKGRGADDGAGHDVNDDKGGRKGGQKGGKKGGKGRGADDAPGHDLNDGKGGRKGGRRRGRGGDDGPNHT